MIIWGIGNADLGTVLYEDLICPDCGSEGTVTFVMIREHFHIFWIPCFPVGKAIVSACTHCETVREPKEMTQQMKQECKIVKSETKGPLWQFIGLLLVVGFIGLGIISSIVGDIIDEQTYPEYIAAPRNNDVYGYKTDDGKYTSSKVVHLSKDSVYLVGNNFFVDSEYDINDLQVDEHYDTVVYALSKPELVASYESGDIIYIRRYNFGEENIPVE